jgi:hypothetical protein
MSLSPVSASKKRRTTNACLDRYWLSDEEDEIEEEKWHPLFRPNEEKVVFVSSDKKYFSVNKAMLSRERRVTLVQNCGDFCRLTISTVFKDMFDLPQVDQRRSYREKSAILIDETAHCLEAFFTALALPDWCNTSGSFLTMDQIAVIASLTDRFACANVNAWAETELATIIETSPFIAFAAASWRQDVELGRRAIGWMDFTELVGKQEHVWYLLSDSRPEWQIEWARRFMSAITQFGMELEYACWQPPFNRDLRARAGDFNPKCPK